VWEDEIAVFLEENRKNDTVENDVVLPDKVKKFRVFVLPPKSPVFAVLFSPLHSGSDIPQWRI
jgi:hypothetical protein